MMQQLAIDELSCRALRKVDGNFVDNVCTVMQIGIDCLSLSRHNCGEEEPGPRVRDTSLTKERQASGARAA
jgi:hypothetical protein